MNNECLKNMTYFNVIGGNQRKSLFFQNPTNTHFCQVRTLPHIWEFTDLRTEDCVVTLKVIRMLFEY